MYNTIDIKVAKVGNWNVNSYQIIHKNESWIIDPGENFDLLHSTFETSNIKGIICTHGHFDHIGAVYDFQKKYKLKFYLHSSDKRILHQANLHKRITGDHKLIKTPNIDFFLDDIKTLNISDKIITIYHTPGHTEGSVVFAIDNCLFTGDIFFYNGIKENDLPGGNKNKLINSLDFIINNFKGYIIYPGHGNSFELNLEQIEKYNKIVDEYRNQGN